MLITVSTERDIKVVSESIRTEEVMCFYEDPYEDGKVVIVFYDGERDDLHIEENFESFFKRFSELEVKYYYDTGDIRIEMEDENNEENE